ncbi:MAG: putative acetyltransferase [Anaerolineales bacterium]|nr:putative acetyltransferase [Anaerolineales bacterium]
MFIRRGVGRMMFAHLGRGARIRDHNIIFDGKRLFIGDNFTSGKYNYFAGGEIRIGDNVRMANFVVIETTSHYFSDPTTPIKNQGVIRETVTIGDDVWIADRVVILPGVTIGRGSIIGAAGVVTNDIPAFSVAVGHPAQVIKHRAPDNQEKG